MSILTALELIVCIVLGVKLSRYDYFKIIKRGVTKLSSMVPPDEEES